MDSNKNLEINKNIKTDNFFIVQLSTGKYLWKFIVFKEKKLSFILWNFSVRTLQCSKKKTLFCPWKHEKPHSKVAHNRPRPFSFSIANRPKSSPNLNSCPKKISHRGTSLQWLCSEPPQFCLKIYIPSNSARCPFRARHSYWAWAHGSSIVLT